MSFRKNIREPSYAGQFYPGTKSELKSRLNVLFAEAGKITTSPENIRALISPHAGYMFSGEVAASAFNQIPSTAKYKKIFVLASSHRYSYKGAAVYTSGNYSTPLGEIEVDTELAKRLIRSSHIFQDKPEAHYNEHSLEVQLPFLQQKIKNNFLLVPIILGTNNSEEIKEIAQKLSPFFTFDNLFVISTDFSHYPKYDDALNVDLTTAEAICKNDPDKLLSVLEENKRKEISNLATSLCGWTSVLTLLHLTKNKPLRYKMVQYQNSGDAKTFGDKQRVVGYWAISIVDNSQEDSFRLTEKEQEELLKNARYSIEQSLLKGEHVNIFPATNQNLLKDTSGAFVSIYVKGELRGCIGSFARAKKPLNEVVQKNAVSASRDIRFEPIHLEEMNDMELEISVLSSMRKITSINEIQLGKHGVYIKKGLNSGTFLPQVATKTGWNLSEFLGHCSRDKAGLGWEGWKSAEIFIYEAFIFREKSTTI